VRKVYCERGAYRRELRDLENGGLIQLVHFPYEGHNRKVRTQATPSVVTFDTTYITADSTVPIGEMVESDKFRQILAIIGSSNEFDARHLDSAYKSGCDCFLTPDKADIVRNSNDLERLLGIRIFSATDDWSKFFAYVRARA
jgi:hypothetical protein